MSDNSATPPPPRYGKHIALAALIAVAALLIPTLMRSDDVRAQTPDDRATLEALYDATGGTGWTTNTNWKAAPTLVHTFKLTAGTSAAGSVGYNASGFTSFGSVRDSSGSVTLNGRTYTLRELFQSSPSASSNPNEIKLQVKVSSGSAMPTNFAGHHLRIGTTTLAIADATAQNTGGMVAGAGSGDGQVRARLVSPTGTLTRSCCERSHWVTGTALRPAAAGA